MKRGRKPKLTQAQTLKLRNIVAFYGEKSEEVSKFLESVTAERERGKIAKRGRARQHHARDVGARQRERSNRYYNEHKDEESFKAKRKEINARYWKKASGDDEWKKRRNERRKELRNCKEFRKRHREYMQQYRQRKKENESEQGTI